MKINGIFVSRVLVRENRYRVDHLTLASVPVDKPSPQQQGHNTVNNYLY